MSQNRKIGIHPIPSSGEHHWDESHDIQALFEKFFEMFSEKFASEIPPGEYMDWPVPKHEIGLNEELHRQNMEKNPHPPRIIGAGAGAAAGLPPEQAHEFIYENYDPFSPK